MHAGHASQRPSFLAPALIAIGAGASTWILAGALTGRKEPWDGGAYWMGVYPVSLLVGVLLARWCRAGTWRFPMLVFFGQFVGATIRAGEVSNLWPIALSMFAVLALPGVALAKIAVRLRSPT